jgi:hypothetical protein
MVLTGIQDVNRAAGNGFDWHPRCEESSRQIGSAASLGVLDNYGLIQLLLQKKDEHLIYYSVSVCVCTLQ